MDEHYTLDYMITVFTDHVEITEKDRKDHPERHIPREDNNFPEFNICKAFLAFSMELKSLKSKISLLKDEVNFDSDVFQKHLVNYHD